MMSHNLSEEHAYNISIIFDDINHTKYYKGALIGKGGFARCYKMTNCLTNEILAGKFIDKRLLMKDHQKSKLVQEILIHRRLNHENIAHFHSFFEDDQNVYIMLEYCKRKSLLELLQCRQTLTDTECRYIIKKISTGCHYLHSLNIIHRDLKLSNILVNENGCIKIGDFGLSTVIEFPGQLKKTVCGTPNYIAPEILNKIGHSYPVDAWSLGCILYTLLVGHPPFETPSLQETYWRIKKIQYSLPKNLSTLSIDLIKGLLTGDVSKRLTIEQILKHEFLNEDQDLTSLTYNVKEIESFISKIKYIPNKKEDCEENSQKTDACKLVTDGLNDIKLQNNDSTLVEKNNSTYLDKLSLYLSQLATMDANLPYSLETKFEINPLYWADKWVDYSDKYGLGYQLCDGSFGVLFNDNTKLLLLDNNIRYIKRKSSDCIYTLENYSENLTKKLTLLKYFKNYMNEYLQKASIYSFEECHDISHLPYLKTWYRTKLAILLFFSNNLIQINFFSDHKKLLICCHNFTITHFDEDRKLLTHSLFLDRRPTCCDHQNLIYAYAMVNKLLEKKEYLVL